MNIDSDSGLRKKSKKCNLDVITFTNYETTEIFDKNNIHHIPLIKYIKALKIKTRYLYLPESKNYICFSCYKKISIKKRIW